MIRNRQKLQAFYFALQDLQVPNGQPGFFDLSDRYEALSAAGDPLGRLAAVIDFEVFRGPLVAALRRSTRGKGGRPPFDPVLMFKILVLQALYSLSDEATEFQIKDRLSFQLFLGLGLYTKAKVKEGADPKAFKPVDLAIPVFGYENNIGIDRTHGLIRTWDASAANAHDGARLPDVVSKDMYLPPDEVGQSRQMACGDK
jgi:hypothetical protein